MGTGSILVIIIISAAEGWIDGYWNTEKGEMHAAERELATLWCTSEETRSRKA